MDIKIQIHSPQISTYEICSLTVWDEHGIFVSKNTVLILCVSQWLEDKTVRISNEDLHNLYSLPDILR